MRTHRPPRSNVIPLFPELRTRCRHCGKVLEEADSGRRKRYCGSTCRRRASRRRLREEILALCRGEVVMMPKWSTDDEQ